MKKILLLSIIALQFCGSGATNSTEFFDDFGSNKLTFVRCDTPENASEPMVSTVEYVPSEDRYHVIFGGLESVYDFQRKPVSSGGYIDLIYDSIGGNIQVIKYLNGNVELDYNDFQCFTADEREPTS